MHPDRVKLGNTVFQIESTVELGWGGNLALFQTQEPADITIHVRHSCPGEATPHADGNAMINRKGSHFDVVLSRQTFLKPTLFHVFTLLPMSALLLERGTLTLHASYICRNGQGVLFCGPSGVGKSTQAELWHRYRDARVVNGDRVLIMPSQDGAMAASHYLSGTSGICENITLQLEAIVLLEQAQKNEIIKISPLSIFRQLMAQIDYKPSDTGQMIAVSGLVEQLLNNTRVFQYGCRADEDAVDCLEAYLNEHCENNFAF